MATKRVEIAQDWVLLNNGGEVADADVIVRIRIGTILLGTTNDANTPPNPEDCYIENEGIVYTAGQYLWAKNTAPNSKAIIIVDALTP